jgi:Uma2 family endonuclease
MSLAELKTTYTPEDLLVMPDGKSFELVDGQLVERHIGWEAGHVAGQLLGILWSFLRNKSLGWVVGDGASYQCFRHDATMVRKPDMSFISFERMPKTTPPPPGHCLLAPDLAVEVVSPRNTYSEIDEKVQDYLRAGVRLVWVINPETQTAHIYRLNESTARLLRGDDVLDGEEVIPGFNCRLSELFQPPA